MPTENPNDNENKDFSLPQPKPPSLNNNHVVLKTLGGQYDASSVVPNAEGSENSAQEKDGKVNVTIREGLSPLGAKQDDVLVYTMPQEFRGGKHSKKEKNKKEPAVVQTSSSKKKGMATKTFISVALLLGVVFVGVVLGAYFLVIQPLLSAKKNTQPVVEGQPQSVEEVIPPPQTPQEPVQEPVQEPTQEVAEPLPEGTDIREDLVQKIAVSYDAQGRKTTEAVLSLEREVGINYSVVTISEYVIEKKSEYFQFIAGKPYVVNLRGEKPTAASILSITYTDALLSALDIIPADLRIGFLSFTKLEEALYRPSVFSTDASLVNATSTPVDAQPKPPVEIWKVLKAQDVDPTLQSISTLMQGTEEGIYAIVPLSINEMIIFPEAPSADVEETEDQGVTEIISGQDTDKDGLTDREELMYGTSPSVIDSDADTYEDGKEVLALYSPARGAGVRLEDDVQFSRLMNTEFGFSFVQPRSFNQTEVIEGSLRDIVFTAATNESIVVSVQENENRLSLKDWYNELSGGKGIETQEFITKAKYSALVIPDKTAYYVALPNSPYVIVFSYTAQEEFNYFTTVRMMVESVYMTAGASM